jgi:CubicO group peptidase (beta-lactamase class C family)
MAISKMVFLCCILVSFQLHAQVITSAQIDSLVELTMKTFNVPGIAVAIVKNDTIIHAKGYGVRSLNTKEKMDTATLFGIASNTKAFTVAALGILVDEGKLKWDDKVTDYIPEFKMYNPYVTDEFTIKDLLTHRSGLGLGAGDLMIWPDSNNFTIKDIIHNLRYLKPTSSFRTKYDYDNNLYIVAGEVIARVSGMSWENFIQQRILDPLGMNSSAPSFTLIKNKTDIIDPHAPVNGVVQVVYRDHNPITDAAGGIYSSVSDMCKWVIMQMNNGSYGNGKRLFSEDVHKEMWTPQTIMPVNGGTPYNTHFSAYGLGWRLSDVHGYKQCFHTGGLMGIVTQVTLIPELKLGIVVFTNQQSDAAFTAITNTIKDSYFGIPARDWVTTLHAQEAKGVANEKALLDSIGKEITDAQKAGTTQDISRYTGTYKDEWFGNVFITRENDKLFFRAERSYDLKGEMLPYKGNTFIVKWNDRSLDADAYAMFSLDNEGNTAGLEMKAISPLTDFSFDFQDLDFEKVKQQ